MGALLLVHAAEEDAAGLQLAADVVAPAVGAVGVRAHA